MTEVRLLVQIPAHQFGEGEKSWDPVTFKTTEREIMNGFKPWAVVLNPGTDHEEYYADYDTYALAKEALQKIEGPADIMRQHHDGSLTTEF